MNKTHHKPKYSQRISAVATNAVILPKTDFKRIKGRSMYLSQEQKDELETSKRLQQEETIAQIQSKRSQHIDAVVLPETFARTRSTLQRKEEKDYAIQIAEKKANEDYDEIKTVNSHVAVARALHERKRQLQEKTQIQEYNKGRDQAIYEMEENNRLEGLNLYETRERTLREQRRAGRAIISAQIEEHQINKILEAERLDREKKALDEQNRLIKEEDDRRLEQIRQRKKAFMLDCTEAREASIQRKNFEKFTDKKEAQMVIDFQADKAQNEERILQEQRDQKALKEREISELRKLQQRSIDTQAIRDEQAALRIQQEREEKDQAREDAEKAKKTQLRNECISDRELMIRYKTA